MRFITCLLFGVLIAGIAPPSWAQEILHSDTTILESAAPLGIAAPSKHVLLVGIGGWKSCLGQANDQYISNRFFALVANLRRCRPDLEISYVMYCSPGLKAISGDRHVRVYGRYGTSTVAEANIGSSIAQHKPTPDTQVFIMGHSHGGWMAMRATLCLGHVAGLFTMEPVSANLCTTRDYLKNRTRKIFKGRQQIVPDCRRAPTDVDNVGVALATGGNWINYFLAPNTTKGDIYSSPIAEAQNEMIWAPAQGKYNAHHNLGLSATTWSSIENHILSTLSVAHISVPQPVPAPVVVPTAVKTVAPSGVAQASVEAGPVERVTRDLAESRTWWDKSGKYTRTGRFVGLNSGIVHIELADGQPIEVAIEALCNDDRAWIAQREAIGQ